MLHGLIERGVFTIAEAVDLIDTAVSVKSDIAAELGGSPSSVQHSLIMLEAISTSLQTERRS